MMVIYLPVKLEFDRTKRFRVRVRKRKWGRTDGRRTHQSNWLHATRLKNHPKATEPIDQVLLVTYALITKGRIGPTINMTSSYCEAKSKRKTVLKINIFKKAFRKNSKGCLVRASVTQNNS